MALHATPAILSPAGTAADSRWAIATTSVHQTASASCSAQPGRGTSIPWSARASATAEPSGRRRTPFELAVPTSMPRRRSPIVVSRD